MSSNISDFFTKCNSIRFCEMSIGEGDTYIVLPFKFDIAKIVTVSETEEDHLNDYRDERILYKTKKNIASFLEDVDLEMFTFDSSDEELIEEMKLKHIEFIKNEDDYILKDSRNLYRFLNSLKYTEVDFVKINEIVMKTRMNMMDRFINMASDELKIGDRTGKVTEAFMTMRGAMEHSSACIFPENIGKSVSEYSWRETMVKRLYLARKVEVEEFYTEKAKAEAKKR